MIITSMWPIIRPQRAEHPNQKSKMVSNRQAQGRGIRARNQAMIRIGGERERAATLVAVQRVSRPRVFWSIMASTTTTKGVLYAVTSRDQEDSDIFLDNQGVMIFQSLRDAERYIYSFATRIFFKPEDQIIRKIKCRVTW